MTSDHSSISSSSSETSNELDLKEDEEWQDAESDEEEIKVQCLFGSNTFSSVELMLEHCKSKYNFDLVRICYELGPQVSKLTKYVH